jgi:hypothetical protein
MKRIYFIWGGLLGWDGYLTSIGLRTLDSQLRQFGAVKTYMQASLNECVHDIYAECGKDDLCVLGGYSGGTIQAARAAVFLAEKRIPQDIALLINMDGSPQYNLNKPDTIPRSNVKNILNIYNPTANWPGGGCLNGENIPFKNYTFCINHLSFQFNQQVRDIICRAVANLK